MGIIALSNAQRHILKNCWLGSVEKNEERKRKKTNAGPEISCFSPESSTAEASVEGTSKEETFKYNFCSMWFLLHSNYNA